MNAGFAVKKDSFFRSPACGFVRKETERFIPGDRIKERPLNLTDLLVHSPASNNAT
jgi:hypothetical protein